MKLATFVRNECANWDRTGCVDGSRCLVLAGRRCDYFERAVLPPEGYPYPNRTFVQDPKAEKRVRDRYFAVVGRWRYHRKVRFCKCGNPLAKRRSLCSECKAKRQRERWRRQKRKQRG